MASTASSFPGSVLKMCSLPARIRLLREPVLCWTSRANSDPPRNSAGSAFWTSTFSIQLPSVFMNLPLF